MTDPVAAALELAGAKKPHTGPLMSKVAGRTDHLPIDVPGESFVVPADVVSGLGEGNTLNGMHVLDRMFGSRPAAARKSGGTVPIVAAGGEYVVPPEAVAKIGGGDLKRGHDVLHHFVKHVRKETIKTLKKLPAPVK